MTLVHPEKNSFYFMFAIVSCAVLLFTGVFWLVMIYNQTVSTRHAVSELKSEIQSIESENGGFKDKLFTALDGENLEEFAVSRALIKEKNPHYVGVGDLKWVFASQY